MSFLPFALPESPAFRPSLLSGASGAPWPVWRDSTTKDVKFQPLPRKKAAKLYHEARRFERSTRQRGKQDGALGRNGLAVLHALIFDFLNFATGELTPSIASIGRAACISARSAARGLANLKAAGVLHWVRRCLEDYVDGRFTLRQQSNAYGIRPASQWRGYQRAPEPPPPTGDVWGATPALPDAITRACQEAAQGIPAMLRALTEDPSDALALALARLGSRLAGKAANP